jgi:CBS domain containing-hemolysin-like protein
MESEIVLTSILILVLVVVATAKSALDELSDVALRRLASDSSGMRHAAFVRTIQDRYHLFNFTLTFGVHLSIASIAILITSLAFRLQTRYFLLIAFLLMAITLILFRQVVPLLLTQNEPARMLIRLRWPLRVIYPALAVLAHPIYHSLRGFQRDDEPATQTRIEDGNGDEVQALIDVGEEEGIIEEDEGEMIQSIIRFGDRTVVEVMTPRPRIVAVEADTPLEAVRDLMITSKYSRLPVYRSEIDNIEGVIYVRDLLTHWQSGQTGLTAMALARPVYFVPETKPTDELLREMQKARTPMAVVIDEYGGIAGLVTMEDLLEEIVGEIEDEDEPEPQAAETDIVSEGAGSYLVRGEVEVGKVERLFEVELAADDFTTVAGLVINRFGHLPTVGEKTEFRQLEFEVLEADERRVSRVRIQRVAEASAATDKAINVAATEPARSNQ